MDYKNIVKEILSNFESTEELDWRLKGIALLGKMRSGKDTVADYAVKRYGFTKYAFGDALKKYAHMYSDVPTDGEKPRELYQEFGQKCREVDENIWIKCLIGTLNHDMPGLFVISDMRQPNERMFAYWNRIKVIKIESKMIKRVNRMVANKETVILKNMRHETEIWPELLTADYTIENNSSIGVLTARFQELVSKEGLL